MTNFIYNTPTKVVFGRDTVDQTGELVKACGGTKALVHFGGSSALKSGLIDRVCASLEKAGVAFVKLGGVQPNPHLGLVREGLELCKKEGVDFLLAVGGGSVIDSAKGIGYGLASGGDPWDFHTGKRVVTGMAPLGCVLTIAAAGSEMSNSNVITNEVTREKRGHNSEHGRPRFAVMDPALTLTVSPYQTAAGCADILMHTLERYFTGENATMELTDSIAEALMRTVIANAHTLARDPANYDARAEVMWASSLSHNGLTGCGGGAGDWACHQLGHELSGKYDLAHGASLTTVWGSWARYVYKENPARFARLAVNVLELEDTGDDLKTAEAGIEEMEEFFWAIEMPTNFKEAGITASEAEIHEMVVGCSRGGARTVGGFKVLAELDMEAVYKMAAAAGK
ncbi:iron-containing alcohol dehydrogenase [Ruminococcaceae bacterium OttesenSCG-928-D13]|nr:iron-containing alcohol dehydrogenase [Ruminococcaceae bacterium OttesenSCG-928-D13]